MKNYKDLVEKMADVSKKKASWRNETTGRREISDPKQKDTESPNPNKHGPPVWGLLFIINYYFFYYEF